MRESKLVPEPGFHFDSQNWISLLFRSRWDISLMMGKKSAGISRDRPDQDAIELPISTRYQNYSAVSDIESNRQQSTQQHAWGFFE